jgi:hypothetical protein
VRVEPGGGGDPVPSSHQERRSGERL